MLGTLTPKLWDGIVTSVSNRIATWAQARVIVHTSTMCALVTLQHVQRACKHACEMVSQVQHLDAHIVASEGQGLQLQHAFGGSGSI